MKWISIALMLGLASEAVASTSVIPSPLRTSRASHSTAAAAAWSDRNRLNAEIELGVAETEQGSTVIEEEDELSLGANVFKRTGAGTVLEATLTHTILDEDQPTVPRTIETTTNFIEFIIGMPITKNFVVGAELQLNDSDYSYSDINDGFYEQQNVEVTAGFKSGDLYYMGGVRLEDIDDDGTKDDDEVLLLGVGTVKENLSGELSLTYENEEGTKRFLFTSLGTLNKGNLQHILALYYIRNISPSSYKFYRVYYGLDMDLGGVYLLPTIAYSISDSRSYSDSIPSVGMEVGHRGEAVGFYGKFTYTRDETDYVNPNTDYTEVDTRLTAGAYWNF